MATATALAPIKLTKAQKNRLKTGPIKNIQKYIDTFTTNFCRQYGISHWQEDVKSECMLKWWKATEAHPEKMESPQYAKRVIYNTAIQWEVRYRKENHMVDLDGLDLAPTEEPSSQIPDIDLSGLNDVECLILEFHYGFGRGADNCMSLTQIAHKLKRSETWVRLRHTNALNTIKATL